MWRATIRRSGAMGKRVVAPRQYAIGSACVSFAGLSFPVDSGGSALIDVTLMTSAERENGATQRSHVEQAVPPKLLLRWEEKKALSTQSQTKIKQSIRSGITPKPAAKFTSPAIHSSPAKILRSLVCLTPGALSWNLTRCGYSLMSLGNPS